MKMKVDYMAKLPLILQDQNLPQISKKIALRYAYKLDWMQRDYINVLIPMTVEELNAETKITLINNEDMLWAEVDSFEEDHYTYLVMFERARDNKVKQEAIKRRKDAIVATGQNIPMQQSEWWAVNGQANAMASQMWSAAIQQWWKNLQTLQNV